MSATLRRRLAALEAALPPPPAELPDDRWWWEALPPAVKAYVLALPAEVHDDPRLQPQLIPGNEGLLYYRRIFGADSAGLAVLDLLIVRRWDGEPVALAEAQDLVLVHAWLAMSRHLHPNRNDGTTLRAAERRMMDRALDPAQYPVWHDLPLTTALGQPGGERHAGLSRLQHWRATRTHDPADLALMGLGPAELALLDATDEA